MKKKTSEPLIVGNKRYYKYKIIWEDIVGDSTLATENEFSKMTCADVHTECWVFDKTLDYVYSFASYYIENGEIEFGDRNIYPRSVISNSPEMKALQKENETLKADLARATEDRQFDNLVHKKEIEDLMRGKLKK